jgi:hypothetical protein
MYFLLTLFKFTVIYSKFKIHMGIVGYEWLGNREGKMKL